MNQNYDCIVVGGGVIGGSIAYSLVKRGKTVLLLERNRLAQKASSAAAGMLAAGAEFENEGPLVDLARKSRAMFPALSAELKELSGIDIELINKGIYKIAISKQEELEFKRIYSFLKQADESVEWLTGDDIRTREKKLSGHIRSAIYLPMDGQVLAPSLANAFMKSAAKLGVETKEFIDVYSIISDNGKIVGVNTNEGIFKADNVIVAGGAWSDKLLASVGANLQAYPVKGECFSVCTERPLLTGTIFSHGCYLVPKSGGRLIVGATVKPNTYNEDVSVDGIATLMEKARRILPSIGEAQWEKAWTGIRPQTSDGLPYLGEVPSCKGLLVATGHYRNGILLSPITGEIIADLVEKKQSTFNLEPYRINRHEPLLV